MDSFTRLFIRASLIWLGIGVVLGVAMAIEPRFVIYRPAHMHANLLGFVSMMIFGVAYHVLPRFTGRALHSRMLANAHVWFANIGLALMVGGWLLAPHVPLVRSAIGAGALSVAAGAFAFIYNIWNTLEPLAAPAQLSTLSTRPRRAQP
jgi:cbb3-type cytochrome oxidase subunit 1